MYGLIRFRSPRLFWGKAFPLDSSDFIRFHRTPICGVLPRNAPHIPGWAIFLDQSGFKAGYTIDW